jgi:hypothetical protein
MLAAGSYTGAAGVLDAGSLQLLYVLHGHKGGVTQVRGTVVGQGCMMDLGSTGFMLAYSTSI